MLTIFREFSPVFHLQKPEIFSFATAVSNSKLLIFANKKSTRDFEKTPIFDPFLTSKISIVNPVAALRI